MKAPRHAGLQVLRLMVDGRGVRVTWMASMSSDSSATRYFTTLSHTHTHSFPFWLSLTHTATQTKRNKQTTTHTHTHSLFLSLSLSLYVHRQGHLNGIHELRLECHKVLDHLFQKVHRHLLPRFGLRFINNAVTTSRRICMGQHKQLPEPKAEQDLVSLSLTHPLFPAFSLTQLGIERHQVLHHLLEKVHRHLPPASV